MLAKTSLFLQLCLILIFLSPTSGVKSQTTQELDWAVKEGEYQTYIYTKYYSIYRENPHEVTASIRTVNGETSKIIFKKGLTISFKVETVTKYGVIGKSTYYGNITSVSYTIAYALGSWIIRKTVDNASYWKSLYQKKEEFSVVNNYVIYDYTISSTKLNYLNVEKWNWKTGWLNYYHEKGWNATMTLFDFELRILSDQPLTSFPINVVFGSSLLFSIGAVSLILRHIQKRKMIIWKFKK
ncbi:MAG: hypothetical protein ACFFAU_04455 [Candidatus Hodarchaeota archaeon]